MEALTPKRGICKYLKAKNSFGRVEGADNEWFITDDANIFSWCIVSTGAGGPDGGIVGPAYCIEGRKCFKPNPADH